VIRLVMIRGSVTVETLPADVSIPQVVVKAARAKTGERGAPERIRNYSELTIWLSLRDNGGGSDDCCRDHSPKQCQSRGRIAASHGIVEEAVRKRASEVVPIGAGRETKKQIEKRK
jgi:hypothetical protein